MKQITLELNRKILSKSYEDTLVTTIDSKFDIIDDSKNKFENLRFVTINGEDINIDLEGVIVIKNIKRHDLFMAINPNVIYAVEVQL